MMGFLIVTLPLTMGQIEDCLPDPTPKSNARPLALDCVVDGTQIFMPLDMTATADRPIEALRGGTFMDTTVTMRIPAAMFCAMEAAQATQTDIESGAIGINFDGVREPGDFFTLHTAVNVPIQNIDLADACAGTYGPDILVDFGTAQAVPWTGDGWTIDLTIGQPPAFLVLLKNIDLPNVPPNTTVDLLTFCDPTDKSVPPNGTTDDPEDSPRIAADRDNDGAYESLATAEDQIRFNVQGYCAGDRCNDYNDCTIDTCDPRFITPLSCTWEDEPDGISCDLAGLPGVCSAGTCVPPTGSDPCDLDPSNCTKVITLGCTNNVTMDVTVQTFELTVTPDPLVAGTLVPVNYSGTILFPELFLDGAQGVPGGVIFGDLVDAQATVHVRSGATASDVTLTAPVSSLPATCFFDQASCDPANDLPSIPGLRGNTDCVPVVNGNACQHVVAFPTSFDCAPSGTCDSLGKSVQCATNGFCITGPLEIPLVGPGTTITPDASGQVLFGWDDQSTGATLNPDGTWNLPLADFTAPTGPNGIRLNAQGLAVALRCTMGVDAGGLLGPFPPVPDQSSPTPDSELINFNIQIP